MKRYNKYAILSITGLLLAGLTLFGSCKDEKDEENTQQTEIQINGIIKAYLDNCYGNMILIEVGNLQIGNDGTLSIMDTSIDYKNSIGIPVGTFSQTVFSVGDYVSFKAVRTNSEDELFLSSYPCPAVFCSPNVPLFKVIQINN